MKQFDATPGIRDVAVAATAADLCYRRAPDAAAELPGFCRPRHPRRAPDLRWPLRWTGRQQQFQSRGHRPRLCAPIGANHPGVESAFGDSFRDGHECDRRRIDRRGLVRLFLFRLIGEPRGEIRACAKGTLAPPTASLTNSSLALFVKICAWTCRPRYSRRIPIFSP